MKKPLLIILVLAAVAGALYYLWDRSRLPSNWSSLTAQQKSAYRAALARADAIRASGQTFE